MLKFKFIAPVLTMSLLSACAASQPQEAPLASGSIPIVGGYGQQVAPQPQKTVKKAAPRKRTWKKQPARKGQVKPAVAKPAPAPTPIIPLPLDPVSSPIPQPLQ